MKRFPSILTLIATGLLTITSGGAAPTSVGGDTFTLVATNSGGTHLFGLAADEQGDVYAGNNSNGPGIPLQRFRPAAFTGTPIAFEAFGPACDDGDGLAFGAGFFYVADVSAGVRKISATDGFASVFRDDVGLNLTGSPLVFRPSDGHIFAAGFTPQIQEFDAAGAFVINHTTAAMVETMAFDAQSGTIYYAPWPDGQVRAYHPETGTDTLFATIDGTIDGGLTVDRLSQRLFVGTANGANQGRVYTVDLATRAVRFFAFGFDGCPGILREQVSGDLYFLEAHSLYRLSSASVTNSMSPRLFVWPAIELGWLSDTSQMYQVQWRTALDTNVWNDFGPPLRGNGATNFLFDTTRTGPQRFYRVFVVPE